MEHYIKKSDLVAEIEKRIEHNTEWKDACKTLAVLAANQAIEEDKKILSIIDTLEVKYLQEDPVSDDLEEEIQRYKDSHDYMCEYIRKVARYFALWGKIHLKDPVCKELEEAATRAAYHQYQDREKDYISENEKKKFIEGAQWQRQQMVKDAVEVQVNPLLGETFVGCRVNGYKVGDKVKLIIVKED